MSFASLQPSEFVGKLGVVWNSSENTKFRPNWKFDLAKLTNQTIEIAFEFWKGFGKLALFVFNTTSQLNPLNRQDNADWFKDNKIGLALQSENVQSTNSSLEIHLFAFNCDFGSKRKRSMQWRKGWCSSSPVLPSSNLNSSHVAHI